MCVCVVFQRREFEEGTLEVLAALPGFMKSQEVQDTDTDPKLQVNKMICMNTGVFMEPFYFLYFKGAVVGVFLFWFFGVFFFLLVQKQK